MPHLPQVIGAEYVHDHLLRITFSDGTVGAVDFTSWLRGPVFEPLKDVGFFRRFYIDGVTVAWPNGAAVAPEALYEKARASDAAVQAVSTAGPLCGPPLNRRSLGTREGDLS